MPTKQKEQKFDKKAYAEEVEKAQEEADAALAEPISADIYQSEWDLRRQRLGQEDAKWLFAVVEEHGAPNIVADPEPDEDETAIDETYANAEADTANAKQSKDDDKDGEKKK
jgi:hypothetical protein